ncbi:Ceramide-1-phosphate transfer protein [Portunus trituberculatus]|uniref:Ceramide-1-phosphate transfer protein n=2 Tax=Portunus trituberculatus TaxID=210409 RepID=A0A5B7FD61_PORTR|nr:Ceramide-1-phosphate transfer protein [Portunus trituberculatus]
MWMLSTSSPDIVVQHENLDTNSIDTLEWLEQQQIRGESGIESKKEMSGLAAKVVGNEETEGSHTNEMQEPSLSAEGEDTDKLEESVGGGEFETEAVVSVEDKLMEEDTVKEFQSLRPDGTEHERLEDMDSHTLDSEETRNTMAIKPKILKVIHHEAQQCQQGGEVFLHNYVDMYRHLLKFFHIFGTFASVQGRMLEARLLSVEKYIRSGDGQHYSTLAAMIHFEDVTGRIRHISPFSGTTLFTCLQRHLQFMNRCLANVLPLNPDMSLLRAFQAAYQEVLEAHHEWFVANFYLTGIGMLPTKEAALRALASVDGDRDATSMEVLHNSILAVIRALHQVTQASEATLVSTNALQKIPKQVVT